MPVSPRFAPRRISLPISFILAMFLPLTAYSDPFQNLNFESAVINSGAATLPYWTVTEGETTFNTIPVGLTGLDYTSVSLLSSGADGHYYPTVPPIAGAHDVLLYGVYYQGLYPVEPRTAAVSQTGDIPRDAQSIDFLVRSLWTTPVPYVSVNGIPLPVSTLSTINRVTEMAVDIRPFAGTTSELTFEADGIPGSYVDEDIFELDNISFSDNPAPPAPEPTTLLAMSPLAFLAARRRSR